jgi:hypothetical protein
MRLLERVGRRGRFDNLAEIRTLDPYDDADRDRIVTLTARHDFPWDFDQGVAIAFLRDYGVPSIARLLDRTTTRSPTTSSSTSWPPPWSARCAGSRSTAGGGWTTRSSSRSPGSPPGSAS